MRTIVLLVLFGIIYSAFGQSTYRVLGIRVEFQEDDSDLTTGNGKFDLSVSTEPYQIDPPPHNKKYFEDHIIALGDYYDKASNGMVNISGEIFPLHSDSAYLLPEMMAHYNPNLGDERANLGLAELFRDALLEADKDANIHFNQFNCVVIFHAGVGKDIALPFDETPEDIPSLYISPEFLEKYLGQSEILLRNGTVSVNRGIVLPETESQVGYSLALNGIFAANMGSYIGLPDLFDVEEKTPAIGAFGLMDAGFFNFGGLLPSRPMAWTRYFAGWESPEIITPGIKQTFSISSQVDSITSSYKVKFSGNESFWIEHRWNGNLFHDSLLFEASEGRDTLMTYREYLTEVMTGNAEFDPVSGVMISANNYDFGLPGSGILIWRIDDSVIQNNMDENRINSSTEFRGVRVIEADYANDIGENYDIFDPGYGSQLGYQLDFWYNGNPSPFYENIFNSTSFPAAVSHYNRVKSGVQIDDFSGITEIMQFSLSNEFMVEGYPDQLPEYSKVHFAGDYLLFWGIDSLRIFQENTLIRTVANPLNHTDSLTISHHSANTRYIAAYNNKQIWFAQFDAQFSIIREDILLTDQIKKVALGNGVCTILHGDSLSQFEITTAGINRINNEINQADPFPVYIDDQLFLFTNDVHPFIQGFESIFHPLYESYKGNWWLLTREGELLVLNRDLDQVITEKDLELEPENQPILYYNSPANQAFPAIFFVADLQIRSYTINAFPGENFPIQMVDYGVSDGSEILIGEISGNPLFLTRNSNGAIFAIDSERGARADLSLKLDGPSDYWLGPNGIYGILEGETRVAFSNGVLNGAWNGSGGNGDSYQISLPAVVANPGNKLIEKNSVYNWPNPNSENHTFIRLRLNAPATVNIRIVDLVGDPVMQTSFSGNEGINEYRWNLTNVASGVYLARIEAAGGNSTEYHIIKIMVIK